MTESTFNDPHDSLLFFDRTKILRSIEETFSSGKVYSILEAIQRGQSHNTEFQRVVTEQFPSFDAKQLTNIVWESVPGFMSFLEQCFLFAKEDIRKIQKWYADLKALNHR